MKCSKCGHEMKYGSFPYSPTPLGICSKCFHEPTSYEQCQKQSMLTDIHLFDSELKNMTIENYLKGLAEYIGKNGSSEISGTDCDEEWLVNIIEEYYDKMKSEKIL